MKNLPISLSVLLAGACAGLAAELPKYANSVLADGPAAYWRLNETWIVTGPYTAADATGHSHTFAYQAAMSRTGTGNDVGPRGLEFPGFEEANAAPTLTGGPLEPDNGYLGLPTGVLPDVNDYTIELWFRRGAVGNIGVYLYHRRDLDAGGNTGDYLGLIPQAGSVVLFFLNGQDPIQPGTTALTEGQWYHVAATRSGDQITVYLNGLVEIGPIAVPPPWREINGAMALGLLEGGPIGPNCPSGLRETSMRCLFSPVPSMQMSSRPITKRPRAQPPITRKPFSPTFPSKPTGA